MTKREHCKPAAVEAFEGLVRDYARLARTEIPADRLIDTLDISVAGHVFDLVEREEEARDGGTEYFAVLVVDYNTPYGMTFPLLVDGHTTVTADEVFIELEKVTVGRNLRALSVIYSQVAPLYARYCVAPTLTSVRVHPVLAGERLSFEINHDRYSLVDEGDLDPKFVRHRSGNVEDSYDFVEGGRGLSPEGVRLLEQALFPGGKPRVYL